MSALVEDLRMALSATSAGADGGSTIPYRTAASVSTGTFLTALVVTTLVLLAMVGCIVYARRRGWLVGASHKRSRSSGESIEVKASRRLSLVTTLHVVAYDGVEYLMVESARGSTANISPLGVKQVEQVEQDVAS